MRARLRSVGIVALAAALWIAGGSASAAGLAPYRVVGDAIPVALDGQTGDAARGLKVAVDRKRGNCVACHALPAAEATFPGDVGPSLAGIGDRLSPGQIRLRVVDQTRVVSRTVMPAYYRVDGLADVAPEYRGKPILSAGEIEDLISYLSSLRK